MLTFHCVVLRMTQPLQVQIVQYHVLQLPQIPSLSQQQTLQDMLHHFVNSLQSTSLNPQHFFINLYVKSKGFMKETKQQGK